MAKKNLFKMWGSWIGAGVYVLSFVLAWLLQPKPLLTTSAYYHIVFPILRFPFGLFEVVVQVHFQCQTFLLYGYSQRI